MILFDSEKLTSEYVYISKITTTYVYVTSDKHGLTYNKGVEGNHNDVAIKKVKIPQSVYARFVQNNALTDFPKPRLATLNFYDDIVVSIEIQHYDFNIRGYESAATWRSNFDTVLPMIKEKVKTIKDEVFINGESILWLNKHDKESYMSLNKSNSLRMYHVHAIKLFKIGVVGKKKAKDAQESSEIVVADDKKDMFDQNVILTVHTGKALAYVPNPEAPEDEQIIALSPLLETKKVRSQSGQMLNVNFEERAAYAISSEINPCYANIEFVLQSAKVIGKLYGNEALDFLNIPNILKDCKTVNLTKIHEKSRENNPINKTAETCLAWILGYIYREKDMNNIYKLNRMFRFIMNKGLVRQNDIEVLSVRNIDGIDEAFEIPLISDKVNELLHRNTPLEAA